MSLWPWGIGNGGGGKGGVTATRYHVSGSSVAEGNLASKAWKRAVVSAGVGSRMMGAGAGLVGVGVAVWLCRGNWHCVAARKLSAQGEAILPVRKVYAFGRWRVRVCRCDLEVVVAVVCRVKFAITPPARKLEIVCIRIRSGPIIVIT